MALRARTRRISESRRERACGLLPTIDANAHPFVRVSSEAGRKSATWHGVGFCGHIWSCPVCAQRLRAERAARVVAAVHGVGGTWRMLTVTIRHAHGMPLQRLQRGLMAAWRRTRQGGAIQRLWTRKVRASVRATEVTYGKHGWHPHLHVLLAGDAFDADDHLALLARFRACVAEELGPDCVPNFEHGLVWSTDRAGRIREITPADTELASYVAKFSCEVSGVAKDRKGGGSSPWDVAERAARGDQVALRLWREFLGAMRGRRAIELDDRAARGADAHQGKLASPVVDGESIEVESPPTHGASQEIQVTRDELRALRMVERRRPTILWDVLEAAVDQGAPGVREWIGYALALVPVPEPPPLTGYARQLHVVRSERERVLHREGPADAPACGL